MQNFGYDSKHEVEVDVLAGKRVWDTRAGMDTHEYGMVSYMADVVNSLDATLMAVYA